MAESSESAHQVQSPFQLRRELMDNLNRHRTLDLTLTAAYHLAVGIESVGQEEAPWRILAKTNFPTIRVEIEGNLDSSRSAGAIAFETNSSQPEYLLARLSLQDEHFSALWKKFGAETDAVIVGRLRFRGDVVEDHGNPDWLRVLTLDFQKIIVPRWSDGQVSFIAER